MESRGSLEVEEEAQDEVKGMQCKHSTFTPGFSGLDNGGRSHEPGKAEWLLEAGKRKETDSSPRTSRSNANPARTLTFHWTSDL